jgi:transcriptional regulator with XRE-family HTH domain
VVATSPTLREIRKALGWTQQELADALRVSRRVVSANETGKIKTPHERLLAARWLQHVELVGD